MDILNFEEVKALVQKTNESMRQTEIVLNELLSSGREASKLNQGIEIESNGDYE